MAIDAPGMKGYRSRNEDGTLRRKRGDTLVGSIEEQYNVSFGVRSDMRLDTLLKRLKVDSLNDALEIIRQKK
jgi:hypothetical protein